MDIQKEVALIHAKYGISEKANYEIQKLFEKYCDDSNKLSLPEIREYIWENFELPLRNSESKALNNEIYKIVLKWAFWVKNNIKGI